MLTRLSKYAARNILLGLHNSCGWALNAMCRERPEVDCKTCIPLRGQQQNAGRGTKETDQKPRKPRNPGTLPRPEGDLHQSPYRTLDVPSASG